MKILISAPALQTSRNVSGVSAVVRQILSILGEEVELRHITLGSETGGRRAWRTINSVRAIVWAAATILIGQYDVFHSNTALNPRSIVRDAALVCLARARGRSVLLHLHGGKHIHDEPPQPLRAIVNLLVRLSNRIVVLSEIERAKIEHLYPGAQGKVAVNYNGVAIDPAKKPRTRTKGAPLRVGVVGRLVEEKGILVLLDAAKLVGNEAIMFSVFGDGPMKSEVVAAEASGQIVYRGVFGPTQMQACFDSIDVLAMPSLHGEGMPMALLEGMASGVVPVATPISSIPEVISDGVNGVLIEAGSSLLLADALRRLAHEEEVYNQLSANAITFAKEMLDGKKNYARLLPLYQSLLSRGSTP